MYDRDVHNDQMQRYALDAKKSSIDPRSGFHASIQKLEKNSLGITQISIIEAPKAGARISADICKMWQLPNANLQFFVGDGVNFFW